MALLVVSGGLLGGLYFANASWVAVPGRGAPRVIAQRGVSQRYSTIGYLETGWFGRVPRICDDGMYTDEPRAVVATR